MRQSYGLVLSFLAFWVLTAGAMPADVDMIIDSDLLDCSGHYRRQCEIELATLTGRRLISVTLPLLETPGSGKRGVSVAPISYMHIVERRHS